MKYDVCVRLYFLRQIEAESEEEAEKKGRTLLNQGCPTVLEQLSIDEIEVEEIE